MRSIIAGLLLLLCACRHAPSELPAVPSTAPSHRYKLTVNPFWGTSFWYVDNSMTVIGVKQNDDTGPCADDGNTGTVANCPSPGIGPLKTGAEILRRWGTSEPQLQQATRIAFLSDDNETPFALDPVILYGGSFVVTGAFSVVSTGVFGTVVPKNRNTPQLLTADLGQSATPFIGMLVSNVTHPSYAWIDSATIGSVATLGQPASIVNDCSSIATEQDTYQSGDSYQILKPVKVPLRSFNPQITTEAFSGIVKGITCLENVWIPDPGGTPSDGSFDYNISSPVNQSRIDPEAMVRIGYQIQEPEYSFNTNWNGGIQNNAQSQNAPGIVGGIVYGSEAQGSASTNNGGLILDGDVIVHGFTFLSGSSFIAAAYLKSQIKTYDAVVLMGSNVGPAALWGPGFLKVGPHTEFILQTGTATSDLLMKGGLFFGNRTNVTTGCAVDISVDPSAWHCNRALNPANIDATIAGGGFGGAAIDPTLQSAISVGER